MNTSTSDGHTDVRLQKYLAECGCGSRRGCEESIKEGRVEVNGRIVRLLGSKVRPAHDEVKLDGRVVRPRRKYYVALHKPVGYVSSRREQGRAPVVLDLLPEEWGNLYPVGRLDRESEGLLLLTNDGEFCLRATHPRFGVSKMYEVTVRGRADGSKVRALTEGIRHHGELLRAISIRIVSSNNTRSRLEIVLKEGKNREVRRLLGAVGYQVQRLIRLRVGPVRLGELPPGKWRALQPPEIRALRQGVSDSAQARGRRRASPKRLRASRQPTTFTP